MSESRAMIVRAGGDPSRLIVVNRPTRRVVSAGVPGANGRSIVSVSINGSGHLLLGYSDGSQDDAGLVVGTDGVDGLPGADGADGTNGSNGAAGEDGRGIASMTIDGSNHLIITYTDASTEDAGLIAGGGGSSAWGGITGTLADQTDLVAALNGKASSAQGALADSAVQPAALTSALAGKVDVDGAKVLSDENYTSAEKSKLAGLESSHWRGLYASLVALEAAHPTASAGDYADVDAGTGFETTRHLWDVDDAEWIPSGSGAPLTAADVKSLYESNADTNAYSDAEKAKLAAIAAGATANANTDSLSEGSTNKWFTEARVRASLATGLSFADSTVIAATDSFLHIAGKLAARLALAFDRANHTGTQATGTITGLDAALADKAPLMTSRTITGTSGTLLPSDAGKLIICTNASAVALAVQLEATGTWADSSVVHILQAGAGVVTVADGGGITVNVYSGLTKSLRGQHGAAALIRSAADSFVLTGTLGGTPA